MARASELKVLACGSIAPPLYIVPPEHSALIESNEDHVVVTETVRMPLGKDWRWINAPLWRYVIRPGSTPQVTKTFLLKPPVLTRNQVAQVQLLYRKVLKLSRTSPESREYEDLADELGGRLTAVALTGNAKARSQLWNSEPVKDNAGASDVWTIFIEVYEVYASETGKVPSLRSPQP